MMVIIMTIFFSQIHVGGEISVGSEKTQTSFPGSNLFLALNICLVIYPPRYHLFSWMIVVTMDGLKGGTFFPGSDLFLALNTSPA